MKTTIRISLLAIIGFAFASCAASLKVATDYDRSVDFSQYRTFGIYQIEGVEGVSAFNRNRIYSAIRAAMTENGYSESRTPDLWVNAVAFTEIEKSVSSTTTGFHQNQMWGMGGMHRPYMWGNPGMVTGMSTQHTRYQVNKETDGILLIDIIDARSGMLVWQAESRRRIDKQFRREQEEKINKYVREILERFPPKP